MGNGKLYAVEIKILKGLVAAFGAASKDATRYHVNFMQIKRDGDKVQVNACDGHILVQASVKSEGLLEMLEGAEEAFIDKLSIELIKTYLKTSNKVGFSCLAIPAIYSQENAKYPNIEQLIPKTDKTIPQDATIGLDFNKLEQINKACSGFTDKTSIARVTIKDKASPVLIKFSDLIENVLDLTAVIMPTRI